MKEPQRGFKHRDIGLAFREYHDRRMVNSNSPHNADTGRTDSSRAIVEPTACNKIRKHRAALRHPVAPARTPAAQADRPLHKHGT
jgi:hypothetical protein